VQQHRLATDPAKLFELFAADSVPASSRDDDNADIGDGGAGLAGIVSQLGWRRVARQMSRRRLQISMHLQAFLHHPRPCWSPSSWC